jgi:hypothetical protein
MLEQNGFAADRRRRNQLLRRFFILPFGAASVKEREDANLKIEFQE